MKQKRGRKVPRSARVYSKRHGLPLRQLRWCDRCGAVAAAINARQRRQLDRLGFVDGLCPDCAGVAE